MSGFPKFSGPLRVPILRIILESVSAPPFLETLMYKTAESTIQRESQRDARC